MNPLPFPTHVPYPNQAPSEGAQLGDATMNRHVEDFARTIANALLIVLVISIAVGIVRWLIIGGSWRD